MYAAPGGYVVQRTGIGRGDIEDVTDREFLNRILCADNRHRTEESVCVQAMVAHLHLPIGADVMSGHRLNGD